MWGGGHTTTTLGNYAATVRHGNYAFPREQLTQHRKQWHQLDHHDGYTVSTCLATLSQWPQEATQGYTDVYALVLHNGIYARSSTAKLRHRVSATHAENAYVCPQ